MGKKLSGGYEDMNYDGNFPVLMREVKSKENIGACAYAHETILVVDDEAVVMEVTREILQILGYRVLTAWSGTEAIECYTSCEEKVDLVILDMMLSGLGGGETFDRLKSIDPFVKVILSTGCNLAGQASMIMARGCNGYIQKPFRMQELSQKVREVLGGEQFGHTLHNRY